MKELSWDSFTKKIHIKTEIEPLFKLWATEKGITTWFLSDAEYLRNGIKIDEDTSIQAGDHYTWRWHNWDGKEEGKVLEVKENEFIKFTFAGENDLLVSFEQKETSVLLTLTQSNIPQDEKSKLEIFYGCSNGWTFWLANLKAYVEHGILLNETDIDLRGMDLAGYEFVNM
ncbi:MAG: SRPBCC domain-containing protein [Flavobacteriaceae bacterium]|nr:SRPBCC domain-containing protein [Flavobacteriaceae bacterium]